MYVIACECVCMCMFILPCSHFSYSCWGTFSCQVVAFCRLKIVVVQFCFCYFLFFFSILFQLSVFHYSFAFSWGLFLFIFFRPHLFFCCMNCLTTEILPPFFLPQRVFCFFFLKANGLFNSTMKCLVFLKKIHQINAKKRKIKQGNDLCTYTTVICL